jgi:SAM-dependent methyltransferase
MSADWTKSFFRKSIFTPGSSEAMAAAAQETKFIWKVLGLRKGSRVLDVPCGTGRHSLRLARLGASVLGVDITPEYLRTARAQAKGQPRVSFMRADMRHLALPSEFDAAINIWTSFGYFSRVADDIKMLRGVSAALKPGGLFLLDMMDFTAIREQDGSYVLEKSTLIAGRDEKIVNEWTILRQGKPRLKSKFCVRLYDRRRLGAALQTAGLTPVKSWASMNLDGSTEVAGPRLVVLARKI